MNFSNDDLKKLIYDPASTQAYVLDKLNDYYNGELNIVDPTNPFMFLLEANAFINNSTLQEFTDNIRKLYPIMATKKEDLYHHLVTSDLSNIFATPSNAVFGIYVNIEKLLTNGNKINDYITVTIPKYTAIITNNTEFTFVNDIEIRYYNTNKYYVKLIGNTNSLAEQNTTLIPTNVVTNTDGTKWLYFELELKQIKLNKYEDVILPGQPFYKKYSIPDQYVYMEAYAWYTMLNQYAKLNLTYSQFYYDPNTPTLYVIPSDGYVITEIPGIYIFNNTISNSVKSYIYSTKGVINLNLEKLNVSDFDISYNNVDNPGIITTIPIYVKAMSNTYGGRDEIDFLTFKNMVIKHTTGNNSLPITEPELQEKLSELGFIYNNKNDDIISREYTANKDIYDLGYDVDAYIDVYSKKFNIEPSKIDNYYIKEYDNSIIVNPFAIFKYDPDTDNISILSKSEVDTLENESDVLAKINEINNNKYVYNIHKYIIDKDNGISTRAYDINVSLSVSSPTEILINPDINASGIISNRTIYREQDDYYIRLDLLTGDQIANVNITDFKIQIGLANENKTTYYYYQGDIIKDDTGIYGKVKITTDGYIDSENNIIITEPLNNTIKTKIPLTTEARIVIYTESANLNINDYLNINEYLYDPNNLTAIYKENVNITFGTYLEYLYTNTDITYTPRKYKRYTEDVYLTYTEDVYKTDEYGIVLKEIDTDGDGENDDVTPVVLHKAGDLVLDDEGNPILLHKAGDIMLDDNGNPIIDPVYGVMYTTELLLLDYEFKASNVLTYMEYRTSTYNKILEISTILLKDVNNELLDNTLVLYRPKDTLNKVKLIINDVVKTTPVFIQPTVTVYSTEYISDTTTIENIKKVVKLELQKGIRENLRLTDIANNIISKLGETFISVNITDTDDLGNIGYKKYTDDSGRLVIDKIMKLDITNAIYPDLNVNVDIVKI